MNKLTDVLVKPLRNFKYLKPLTVEYILGGKKKSSDILCVHKGVSVLVYNTSRDVLVFVRQFRPVVYLNRVPEEKRTGSIDTKKYPGHLGITLELCAGIVDKEKPLEQIAIEEIREECNYEVKSRHLEKIVTYRSDVTWQGTIQTLFYCEVTDDMKTDGEKEENVDAVEMNVEDVRRYISQKDCCTTAIFLYGIQWFLNNKFKK